MDIFDVFRTTLAIAGTCYTAARLGSAIWYWTRHQWSDDRAQSFVRRYLWVTVLRLRFRRFAPDFLQIIALAALLIWLIKVHVTEVWVP